MLGMDEHIPRRETPPSCGQVLQISIAALLSRIVKHCKALGGHLVPPCGWKIVNSYRLQVPLTAADFCGISKIQMAFTEHGLFTILFQPDGVNGCFFVVKPYDRGKHNHLKQMIVLQSVFPFEACKSYSYF